MKKRIIDFLLVLNMVVCMAGFGVQKAYAGSVPHNGNTEGPASIDDVATVFYNTSLYEEEWYIEALKAGTLSTGTNGRFEYFIRKLQKGKKVTIAFIGGSVTEGGGVLDPAQSYGDQFIASLGEKYPKAKIEYVNAGVGGTSSAIGALRYDRDVTKKCSKTPDLVVVEFSVNDQEDPTNGRAYESLIRQILETDDETAVVQMFAVFKSRWNTEDLYKPVGNLYGTPMVSVKDGTAAAFEAGYLNNELYFSDDYHPTALGHKIMADTLMNLVNEVDDAVAAGTATKSIAPVPATYFYSPDFLNMKLVSCKDSNGAKVTKGSFSQTDTQVHALVRNGEVTFPYNWSHDVSSNEPFVLEVTCKNILFDYKRSISDEYGKAEIYVDGELVAVLDGYKSDAWNNSYIELVYDSQEVAKHKLEIRMAEEDKDKKFTILGIAYSDKKMTYTQDPIVLEYTTGSEDTASYN